MDLCVKQWGDDPLRFLLHYYDNDNFVFVFFFYIYICLPVHPAVQEETRTKELGQESRFLNEPFLGLEGGTVLTAPCRHTLSSLINSYVPYFSCHKYKTKKNKQKKNNYRVTY